MGKKAAKADSEMILFGSVQMEMLGGFLWFVRECVATAWEVVDYLLEMASSW
jgi:hypothetical protein